MKIALVIASLGPGGAERVMSLLANNWAERGDEVTLVTLESRDADVYAVDRRVRRVALGLVSDSNGLFRALASNWRRIRALRAAIRSSGAPVVLSFEDRTNVIVVMAALGLNVRCVVSERTDPTRHHIGAHWNFFRRLSYPFADALVVQTAQLMPWAGRVMFGSRRVHAIPNPLRIPLEPTMDSLPARPQPTVTAVGRLWAEKGYDVLIRAFASIAADFPEWTVTIVGEGPERESLAALTAELSIADRVALPGWTPEPERALSRAALFVTSSRYEGFPNALLEAMATGLPVISTACTGSSEIVTDGHDGVLVAVDDVEALALAMRKLMADAALRRALGENALATSRRYLPSAIIPMWDAALAGAEACAVSAETTAPSP